MDLNGFYDRLEELCSITGLNIYQLVKRSGMSQSTLYNMIRRRSMPGLETITSICKGLGVSASEFFRDESSGCIVITDEDEEFVKLFHKMAKKDREELLLYMRGKAGVLPGEEL